MSLFDHRHYWHALANHEIVAPDAKGAASVLLLQGCRCGVIRTIEYRPGFAPVIRYAETKAAS